MTTYAIELNNEYANQEFDIVINEVEKSIHILLQTVENVLMMSVFVNNEQIGIPFMCFPNQPVIPYPYMERLISGNFIFETQDDNYPNWETFDKTCFLYFVTLDELNNAG